MSQRTNLPQDKAHAATTGATPTSTTSAQSGVDSSDPRVAALIRSYWRKNLTTMAVLLAIWAFVGLGCGILWADWLNQYAIGGFPLGFWFAQQGSIATFIVLILVYCLVMNRLDRQHHKALEKLRQKQTAKTSQ